MSHKTARKASGTPDQDAPVAGYLRVSGLSFPEGCRTPQERATYVESLRRVRMSELTAEAARHGDEITVWYDDMGVSARGEFRDRRDGLARLCRDARGGRARRVYARDLSRLFRDVTGQEVWFAEMEAAGVEVLAADLPGGDPATRRLLRQQLGAVHEYLSARNGALMGAMLRERVWQGLWVGRHRDAWGLRYDPATKGFATDPDTAGRALAVFEAFNASGGLPTAAAWRLNRMVDEGRPRATGARWGGRWTQEQVRRFVTNPLYRRATLYGGVWAALPGLIPEAVPAAVVAEADRLLALSARDRGLVEA